LLGKRTQDLIHPDCRESQAKRLKSIVARDPIPPSVESRFLQLDGTPIDVEVQGTAIEYDGTEAIHVSIRNITERKQMQDRVRQLAFYDPLTQLPNRRLLDDRLRQALTASKRRASFGALMFLDLDKLKPINDTHGHEAGDALLIDVAQRLNQCVRESDTVARLGGDEFVVMLTDLGANSGESASQAAAVAEKIRFVLAQPYALKSAPSSSSQSLVGCAASIGVILFGDKETDTEALLNRADRVMYQAKKAGGNSVVFEGA
jgi:diguanylate cyclase (GGDEF)-like protein